MNRGPNQRTSSGSCMHTVGCHEHERCFRCGSRHQVEESSWISTDSSISLDHSVGNSSPAWACLSSVRQTQDPIMGYAGRCISLWPGNVGEVSLHKHAVLVVGSISGVAEVDGDNGHDRSGPYLKGSVTVYSRTGCTPSCSVSSCHCRITCHD